MDFNNLRQKGFGYGEGHARTFNWHPDYDNTYDCLNGWGAGDLKTYLLNNRLYGMAWLFSLQSASDIYNPIVTNLPIPEIVQQLYNLSLPVWSSYTEITKNLEFAKISRFFYRELYFQEEIYVGYDVFINGEYDYENNNINEEPPQLKHLRNRPGFDIFVKLTRDDLDDNNRFMHIETGIVFEIENWRDTLIKVENSGTRMNNFFMWFKYSILRLILIKQSINYANICCKKMQIRTALEHSQEIDRIKQRIDNVSPYLILPEISDISIRPTEYATGTDFRDFVQSVFYILDREVFEIGRVSNQNPGGTERTTTGDHYKDIISIGRRENNTLECLNRFGQEVVDKFGIDALEFAVVGVPEKERVPSESARAPNPINDQNILNQVDSSEDKYQKPTNYKGSY